MKTLKTIIIILVIVGLGVGGYFGYNRYREIQAEKNTNYQTVALTRGSLEATVGATGTVRANQTAILTWQTSGSVGLIKARLGDSVTSGEVLAQIEETSLAQSIILAEADLITAQRNLDNLKINQTSRAQAEYNLVQAQKALDDARQDRKNLDYRGSQASIDSARAALLQAEKDVERLQDFFDQVADRPEDDLIRAQALSNLSNAKERRDRSKWNLDWLLNPASAQDITEADTDILLAEAKLADAQREYERLKDGADPLDLRAAEVRITAIEATLKLKALTAPFAGTLTEVRSQAGDQVTPGTIAFRIDDLSRLLVDVQVSEIDINVIEIGQAARVNFDAISGQSYQGKVVQVASVGVATQGTVNFIVTVELLDADANVRPGMTAAVNIITQNIEDALLVPNRAVRTRDGQRVVYILKNATTLEPVNITLGVTSDIESQVLSGEVQAGDLAVLNPPAETPGNGQPFFMRPQ
jgi:HlyD family secretion protein